MNLPKNFVECLQGSLPSLIASSSADGVPNMTTISQVFPAGPGEVAISNQFFSKTHKNLLENPLACVSVSHPSNGEIWLARLKHRRTETEGELFDTMEMQLEALASMTGMSGVFKLQAADIFEVLSVERVGQS